MPVNLQHGAVLALRRSDSFNLMVLGYYFMACRVFLNLLIFTACPGIASSRYKVKQRRTMFNN